MASHAPTNIQDLLRRLARVDDRDKSGEPAKDREMRVLEAGMDVMMVRSLTGLTQLVPNERHQVVTDLSSAVGLAIPTGAYRAMVQANGGAVRFRLDGVEPDGDTGVYLPRNAIADLTVEEAAEALFIEATGSTSGIVVTYV